MRTQRVIADRYSLVEPLPGSATGIGWRAQDLWSGQSVVITRVPVSGLVGHELPHAYQEIASNVRALGGLQHDRVARMLDVVLDTDDLWVASEPLPGVTMADELARRAAVGLEEVARWGCDVADGLAAAHGVDVPHRTLHANVVGITEDGRAVVGGFATTVVTPEGLRSGTPVHVAPEVGRGAKPSPASDVFALGAMLYLAVEGREPFPAAVDSDQLLAAVTAGVVAAPQRAGWLGDSLIRMLHPDPAQRPAAAAVAEQLAAAPRVGDSATTRVAPPGLASVGPPPYRVPLPWVAPPPGPGMPGPPGPGLPPMITDPSTARRKRMWWVVVTAVVAVLALAGGLVVAFGSPWTSGLTGRPASPIGDPRTADPCGLLNVGSVQRFGQATMVRDLGYPQSCVIGIGTGGGGVVVLTAMFGAGTQTAVAALTAAAYRAVTSPVRQTR
jgi:eukaryotic-like serine/threonine-protein kinase